MNQPRPPEREVAELGRRVALNLLGGHELAVTGANNEVPTRGELGRGDGSTGGCQPGGSDIRGPPRLRCDRGPAASGHAATRVRIGPRLHAQGHGRVTMCE